MGETLAEGFGEMQFLSTKRKSQDLGKILASN
jgi:hypothetical protein